MLCHGILSCLILILSHLVLSYLILSYAVLYFLDREVVWRLDIVDPLAVEHLLKRYRDILVETWRPARDAEPEFDA